MRNTLSIVFLAATILLTGCKYAQVVKAPPEAARANAPEAQMEFWHQLAAAKLVSNNDALHAVLLLLDGKDDAADYAGRVAALQQRGLLSKSFDDAADAAVRRGTLASLLSQVVGIRGGLMMHLTGPTERYALRELIFLGLMPDGTPNQTMTGGQFIAYVGRADDYQRGQSLKPGRLNGVVASAKITPTPTVVATLADASGSFTPRNPWLPVSDTTFVYFQDKPAAQAIKAVVAAVKGAVQYRGNENEEWKGVEVGQEHSTGVEFRTGVRSAVRFTLGEGKQFILDRLGTVKLLDAIAQGGATQVNLGAKYGKGQLTVEKAGRESQSTVTTPGMTLSIRGTTAAYVNEGGQFNVFGADGRVTARDRLRRVNYSFAGPGSSAVVQQGLNNTAAYALNESYQETQPYLYADQNEAGVAVNSPSSGGTAFRDSGANDISGIASAGGGHDHPGEGGGGGGSANNVTQGELAFVLQWSSDGQPFEDLNLEVVNPDGFRMVAGPAGHDPNGFLTHSGNFAATLGTPATESVKAMGTQFDANGNIQSSSSFATPFLFGEYEIVVINPGSDLISYQLTAQVRSGTGTQPINVIPPINSTIQGATSVGTGFFVPENTSP